MPVRLTTRRQASLHRDVARWVAADEGPVPLPTPARLEPGRDLEAAFDAIIPELLALCRRMNRRPDAVLAHAPSAAVNASDLGTMLAWARLVEGWAAGFEPILVVCDDPWLFRHLAALPGVTAGTAPGLRATGLRLFLRGLAARAAYAARALRGALRPAPTVGPSGEWLLSYHHPRSTRSEDAYFGSLPREIPSLHRLRHVDGPVDHGGMIGLAAWGSPLYALALTFARWRPAAADSNGALGWLVRRAAARDGGTAQGAAIAWQIHCQRRWLRATRPKAVAWPWESHGWERALCRDARALGTRTIGYQHATIGRTELNYHPGGLPDPAAALPDRILCVGGLALRQLAAWGVPGDRLAVGGALRYAAGSVPTVDPLGPVFFALPADRAIAAQMVAAAAALARPVLIRPHPVYGVEIPETALLRRATAGLEHQAMVAAVVFCATSVGLEAVLAGLPTIRFIARGCVALDILPNNIGVPAADFDGLEAALRTVAPPAALRREDVFAPVDFAVWRAAFDL